MKVPAASDAKVVLLFATNAAGSAVLWGVVGAAAWIAARWVFG